MTTTTNNNPVSAPAPRNKSTGLLSEHIKLLTTPEIGLKPHPQTGRLIDAHPGIRTVPMRALCLGMSRTGTMSLFVALKQLGFNPYHMAVAMEAPRDNLDVWTEALDAKFRDIGKPWGRAEFDKVLGRHDAVLDVPAILFVEELIAAYPEAKVVLTSRDVEAWLRSMDATIGAVGRFRGWGIVAPWDPELAGSWWKFAQVISKDGFAIDFAQGDGQFKGVDRPCGRGFVRHYELVKRATPKGKLLDYRVQQGWDLLCKFLEVEAPAEPFPNVNDSSQFVDLHKMIWWSGFIKMATKLSLMVGLPLAGAAGAWWWQYKV